MSIQCPKCQHTKCWKYGIYCNKQRYSCTKCKYAFTRTTPRGKDENLKKMALKMYLEGLGFRAIGRILNVSHQSVFRWIKQIGQMPEVKDRPINTKEIEIDEVHSFVGLKKNRDCMGVDSNMSSK